MCWEVGEDDPGRCRGKKAAEAGGVNTHLWLPSKAHKFRKVKGSMPAKKGITEGNQECGQADSVKRKGQKPGRAWWDSGN